MFNLCNFAGMSRLSIEIDPEQHRQIKTLATFSGMTIKEFILSRTLESSKTKAEIDATDSEMDTTEKLLSSPKNRKRLMDSLKTPRSKYVKFNSVEELEDALGI